MLLLALFLGVFGLALSATFSGSETAFYRIPRIRLKLDAIGRDRTAGKLLWLVNHPEIFISTILVGNNVANYAVSTATVLFVGAVLPNSKGMFVEIGSTLLLAPFLFVYGEMFPKYLCLHAPNRMLRLLSPVILFFLRLFLPVTILLGLLNRLLARFFGGSREMLRLTLGRQELARVLDEGRDMGILFDMQRRLADGVFSVSDRSVREQAISPTAWPYVTTAMKPREVLDIAAQHDLTEIPVYEADFPETGPPDTGDEFAHPVGYVRVIDLELAVRNRLDEQSRQLLHLLRTELPIRGTVEISSRHSILTAMILLQTLHGSFGSIIDEHRRCLGFVRSDQLRDILLGQSEGDRQGSTQPESRDQSSPEPDNGSN